MCISNKINSERISYQQTLLKHKQKQRFVAKPCNTSQISKSPNSSSILKVMIPFKLWLFPSNGYYGTVRTFSYYCQKKRIIERRTRSEIKDQEDAIIRSRIWFRNDELNNSQLGSSVSSSLFRNISPHKKGVSV